MKKTGRNAIRMFGSKNILNLGWRDSWAMIAKKRNTWFAEAHQKIMPGESWGPPIIIQASVELLPGEEQCDWGQEEVALRRKQFCEKYEGYGSVCSCE